MALSAEQRALLELIHDRGLGYEELDDLLGGGPGEARRRERTALAALSEEEAAEFPAAAAPAAGGARRRRVRLAVGALAAVAIGLGAGAIIKGGSDAPSEPVSTAADAPPEPVLVTLEATELGGRARGEAAIGLDDRFAPYLDLDLAELPPAPKGAIYVPWIDVRDDRGLPIPAPVAVRDGAFEGRLDLAPQLLSVLDVGRELEIVPLDRAELKELSRQVQAGGSDGRRQALRSPGDAVLSGSIPAN
jgi:hypothetical protein